LLGFGVAEEVAVLCGLLLPATQPNHDSQEAVQQVIAPGVLLILEPA
jgi:hypothetical protein